MNLSRLLILLALCGAAGWVFQSRPVIREPGVLVDAEPLQSGAATGTDFEFRGYRITPMAEFDLQARVLGRENYRFDREADLSPVDLALGWGPMSDERVLQNISITQSGRWYRWRTPEFPIPRKDIEHHSANMHMIPKTATVEDLLDDVRPGQVVRISGYLIEARAEDGWRWRSSLTREDTGANSCEVVFVERFSILDEG